MNSIVIIAAVVAGVGAPAMRDTPVHRQSAGTSSAPLVRVTVGYYLNDKEEDPSRHCQFLLLDRAGIIEPKVTTGRWYWYPKPTSDDVGAVRIFVKCDSHVALVHPRYPIFSGFATVVLTAYTKPALLRREDPTEFPIKFDDHYTVWADYSHARGGLKREWDGMPVSLRRKIGAVCCVTMSANEGDAPAIQTETWYR